MKFRFSYLKINKSYTIELLSLSESDFPQVRLAKWTDFQVKILILSNAASEAPDYMRVI